MIDPNSPDPSKRKSFFDEDALDNHSDRPAPHPNQRVYNDRERMASPYHDDEEYPYDDQEYDRKKPSRFGFMETLGRGDSGSRRLTYAAGSIGALLVLFVGGWMLFGSSNRGIPVFEPPTEPAKEKIASSGNVETIGLGVGVNTVPDPNNPAGGIPGQTTLAPGPEQPNPSALAEQYAKPPALPPATATNQTSSGQSGQTSSPSGGVSPVAPSTNTAANNSASENVPEPVAPPKKTHVKHHDVPQHKSVETKKTVKTEPKKPVKKQAIATSSNGKFGVQLSALGSESAAQKQWQVLRKKAPELLGGHSPTIQKAEVNGNTVYRLRVKGFASKTQAGAFCSQLKAKSIACTPANF
ncbi:SPOR domain-containing protein [Commensalibacter oyaizuii]|uniref:SPOR domain-containing protein n=1 Tax=Commensalibacter oyaizuii TaxID=3043873 RepID=A0ABT6Q2X5_9PROT|nr:SPOR domain-containing protein [Commensalibacter sp. TBRC 16381]MDI2091490.1 SPOR domain-containing protein [Commensalibacter sp. TBRC 16381]